MENTIHSRLKMLVDHFTAGRENKFAGSLGLPAGGLSNYTGRRQSKPGFEVIAKIMEVYPQVSPEWLLLGKGDMLKPPADTLQKQQASPTHESLLYYRYELEKAQLIIGQLELRLKDKEDIIRLLNKINRITTEEQL